MGRLVSDLSGGSITTQTDTAKFETFHQPIYLVRGDTLPELRLTIKDSSVAAAGKVLSATDDSTWAPYDLTGCTILFKLRLVGSGEVKESISMYVTGDPVDGTVFMQWGTDSLDTAGEFTAEIEITNASGKIITLYKQLQLIIREDY